MTTLAAGMRIGKYELGKQLGEGGFGVVYLARDTGLDRDVALKFLHAEHTTNIEILQRFLQEARASARIVHSGIVTIHECGQVEGTKSALDGTAFIAMELLHGEPLSSRLDRTKQMPASAVAEIGRQVASALEAAHRAGVVHRDLKPDNIFLVTDPSMPSGERAKILDFGIAKLGTVGSTANPLKTATGMVFGTPRYMSPEQCRSAANIDHRSDIYTLGVILFEMVPGRPVFDGASGEQIAKHQLVQPPLPSTLVAVPPELERLITNMLAKEPDDRPQSMDAVRRVLEAPMSAASPYVSQLPPTVLPGQMQATAVDKKAPTPPPITTLSNSAGASIEAAAPPPKRGRMIGIVVISVAIAGAAVLFVALRTSDEPAPATVPVVVDASRPDAAVDAAAVPDATLADAAVPDAARPDAGRSHKKLDALLLPESDAGVSPHPRLDALRLADAGVPAAVPVDAP